MARGEGEPRIQSHFVERVVKLPMVHVAWDYAANTYSHIKESNKLVNFTLTNAEKSVTFVAGQAKPVVLKFEKQIQAVDDLACKGLGTLEEKVPFITKPAEEIIDDTRKLYTSTVYSRLEGLRKYGNDTVKSVTDYGIEKANAIFGNRLVQSVVTSVDGALVVTENYIDQLLPPTPDEKKKDGRDKGSPRRSGLARLAQISSKVRHRAYRTLVLKFEYVQERSLELILTYPVAVIEISKGYVDRALQYVTELWESLKKETEDEKESAEKSPSSSALSVVKDRTLWVIGMLKIVPQLLPMYIAGLLSLLEHRRNERDARKEQNKQGAKENGDVANHAHSNSSHASKPEENYSSQNSHSNHPES